MTKRLKKHKPNSQIIYGRNPIEDALNDGRLFERIYIKDSLHGDLEKFLRTECRNRDIPLKRVPQIKLDQLSRSKNHQGVVAMTSLIDYQLLSDVIPMLFEQGKDPLIVIIDNVQDIRNIGAIARSCEVLGAHSLVLAGKNVGLINDDAVKSSSGALLRLPVCRAKTSLNAIEELAGFGILCYGSSLKATTTLSKMKLNAPLALIFGSEGEGLHHTIESLCEELFMIHQSGKTDSLNVSVATGIALYEVARQLGES